MRAVIWTRSSAAAKLSEQLHALGFSSLVAHGLDEVLSLLPGTELLMLSDPKAAEAQVLAEAIRAPGGTLRHIHFLSADQEGMRKAGIPSQITVSGSDGALSSVVAEHAIALNLALYRQLPAASRSQSDARWDRSMLPRLGSLEDATVLMIGLGHVGRAIATRARAFGSRLVAVNRTPVSHPDVEAVHPLSELDALLPEADVVMLCIASNDQTRHLLDRRRLGLCRPHAVIINVGRGPLIDTDALNDALVEGSIGGAGLDVTDPEPLPPEHPLWRAPNLIVTSHYAGGGSRRASRRLMEVAVKVAERLIDDPAAFAPR